MTEQYYNDIEENYDILDKIDFIPYLKKETNLDKIMYNVSQDYDNTKLTNNEVCHGYTFNLVDESEVENYLLKRYGDKIRTEQETITNIYIELQNND